MVRALQDDMAPRAATRQHKPQRHVPQDRRGRGELCFLGMFLCVCVCIYFL
jgi:hypothetical protein